MRLLSQKHDIFFISIDVVAVMTLSKHGYIATNMYWQCWHIELVYIHNTYFIPGLLNKDLLTANLQHLYMLCDEIHSNTGIANINTYKSHPSQLSMQIDNYVQTWSMSIWQPWFCHIKTYLDFMPITYLWLLQVTRVLLTLQVF
jgi:hypothetical protein